MIKRRFTAAAAIAIAAFLVFAGCAKKGAANAPGAAQAGSQSGSQGGANGAQPSQRSAQAGAQGGAPAAAQAPGGGGGGDFGPGGFGGGARRGSTTAVQATVVPAGLLKASRDTAGVVSPSLQSQIAAGVGGIVVKVLKQGGDWVAAGDVVVQLDDTTLRLNLANSEAALETAKLNLQTTQDSASQSSERLSLQVDSAQASYDSAKRFYDSQKALFDLGGISASALDDAKSKLAAAQANLESAKLALDQNQRGIAASPSQNVEALKIAVRTAENNLKQARLNLENASIDAPFAGQISAIAATLGMYLGQNASAFTLVGPERQVSFSITPSDAVDVRQGSRLSFDTGSKAYTAVVKQSPSVPVNGMISLAASIEGGSALPFGTVGKLSYVVPLARGAFVPIGSIGTLENRNYLFAVEGGRVVTKMVNVLATAGAVAAVEGIDAGTTVILSPPPGLVDGQQVQATVVAVADLAAAVAAAGGDAKAPAAKSAGASPQAAGRPASGAAPGTWPGQGAAQGAAPQQGAAGQGQQRSAGQARTRQGGAAGTQAAGGQSAQSAGKP
jgi:HlyD family secretion protein